MNAESRGINWANYGEQRTISAKYGEQGGYFSKIWRAGELFQKNKEGRGTI